MRRDGIERRGQKGYAKGDEASREAGRRAARAAIERASGPSQAALLRDRALTSWPASQLRARAPCPRFACVRRVLVATDGEAASGQTGEGAEGTVAVENKSETLGAISNVSAGYILITL